jgi:hypothetical protein
MSSDQLKAAAMLKNLAASQLHVAFHKFPPSQLSKRAPRFNFIIVIVVSRSEGIQ